MISFSLITEVQQTELNHLGQEMCDLHIRTKPTAGSRNALVSFVGYKNNLDSI